MIAPQSERDWTAILDQRHELLDFILTARKQLTCFVDSAVTETDVQFLVHLQLSSRSTLRLEVANNRNVCKSPKSSQV